MQEDEQAAARFCAAFMPEYMLPHVIHLLAHHPNFPSHVESESYSNEQA